MVVATREIQETECRRRRDRARVPDFRVYLSIHRHGFEEGDEE